MEYKGQKILEPSTTSSYILVDYQPLSALIQLLRCMGALDWFKVGSKRRAISVLNVEMEKGEQTIKKSVP